MERQTLKSKLATALSLGNVKLPAGMLDRLTDSVLGDAKLLEEIKSKNQWELAGYLRSSVTKITRELASKAKSPF